MKVTWQVLKLTERGHLVIWDGPCMKKKLAKRIIKKRMADYPKDKFFLYREEP